MFLLGLLSMLAVDARAESVRYAIAGDFIRNVEPYPYPYAGSFIGEFDFDYASACGDEGRLTQWSVNVSDDPTSSLSSFHYSSGDGGVGRWSRGCGTYFTFLVADPVTQRGFQFSIVFDDGGQDNFAWGVDEVPFSGSHFEDPPDARVVSRFIGDNTRVWKIAEPSSLLLIALAALGGVSVRLGRKQATLRRRSA